MGGRSPILNLSRPQRQQKRSTPTFAQQPGQPQERKPMGVGGAYLGGWGWALGMPRLLALLWVVNVVTAAALTLPFALMFRNHLGNSALGDRVFGRMPVDAFLEFGAGRAPQLTSVALVLVPLLLVSLLLRVYLSGGIIARLLVGQRETWAAYFAACRQHVWRILAVALMTLTLLGGPLLVAHLGLTWLVARLTEQAASTGPAFYLTGLRWALTFFLVSWVARVYDYSRIMVVSEVNTKPHLAFGKAMRFTVRHGTRTFFLWVAMLLTPLAFVALHGWATRAIGVGTDLDVWLGLAVSQVFILLRILGRVALLAGEMQLLIYGRR